MCVLSDKAAIFPSERSQSVVKVLRSTLFIVASWGFVEVRKPGSDVGCCVC